MTTFRYILHQSAAYAGSPVCLSSQFNLSLFSCPAPRISEQRPVPLLEGCNRALGSLTIITHKPLVSQFPQRFYFSTLPMLSPPTAANELPHLSSRWTPNSNFHLPRTQASPLSQRKPQLTAGFRTSSLDAGRYQTQSHTGLGLPPPIARLPMASNAPVGSSQSPTETRPNGQYNSAAGHWYCNCVPRQIAVQYKVARESPNKGRWFYKCPVDRTKGRPGKPEHCGFFRKYILGSSLSFFNPLICSVYLFVGGSELSQEAEGKLSKGQNSCYSRVNLETAS